MDLQNLTMVPVVLANGIELNYVRAGLGQPLIFVHGAMGDWRAWEPQWNAFTDHFDCISYSRRYSYPNPNPLNSRQYNALVDAEDLEGLMNALDWDQAILVGSSYGGFSALAMALRVPHRVKAVVAVEAPMMGYALQKEELAEIAQTFKKTIADPAREAFENGDDAAGVALLTSGIIGKKPSDIPTDVLNRRMQNAKAARGLALSDDEFPMLAPEALAALSMPVLLLSGQDTAPIHAAIFEAVAQAMPNAISKKVPGAGHSVSQQAPDVFNKLVLSFLNAGQQRETPRIKSA